MKRESVNKFDLEAAFKALNEVEVPVVRGIRPNRDNLQEKFTRKLTSEVLVEDYYDVNDSAELEQAQDEREAEIAKAKLARIEKIVDLDAETEEDLLPSYVGKFIIQCPQCMTLFYKKEEDIEKSEENPDIVNLNEPCQHCGNSSGYTLIGKVDQVGEEEAEQYDAEDFEEDELNLDFEEESAEEETEESGEESTEEASEESTEDETATESEEDEDLAPVEETEEEEEVKESLREEAGKKRVFVDFTGSNATFRKAYRNQLEKDGVADYAEFVDDTMMTVVVEAVKAGEEVILYTVDDDYKYNCPEIVDKANLKVITVSRELTEDVDLNKQLDLYNDFIKYLQKMVEQDEDALEEAKKLGNKEVIAAIEKRLENSKAELKAALPTTVKDEVSAEELPTPEEADMEDAAENKEEKEEDKKEKKESLKEYYDEEAPLGRDRPYGGWGTQTTTSWGDPVPQWWLDKGGTAKSWAARKQPRYKFNDETGSLDRYDEGLTEDATTELKLDAEEAALEKTNVEEVVVEAAKSDVVKALDKLEAELTEDTKITEAKFDVSDADFRAMLKNPVFNEGCKKELEEDLPPVNDAAFDKAADAIEAAGSELTPEEQAQEDAELAAKGQVEESLTESLRTWVCMFDGEEVGTVEAATEEEAYEKMEETWPELHYGEYDGVAEVFPDDDLYEAAPQGEFVSQLKRKYSATELMVKELKEHPLFSSLSTRTIQRVLLPYYIAQMGRNELSTQAMVDFFEFEGFAPYVFDNFMTMDPQVRKELLSADAKFMEIFNDYARTYDSFPGADELDVGETKFSYAFDVIFYIGAQRAGLTERMVKDFSIMYANGKFDKKLCDATIEEIRGFSAEDMPELGTWASIEDFDEESFDTLTEKYLTEVYSNVKSFKATGCSLEDSKLVIEGKITFNSGKTKNTTFVYEAKETANEKIILEGLNADFATEKAFVLNCKVDTAKCLIVESLNYKYSINNTLVEGLLK